MSIIAFPPQYYNENSADLSETDADLRSFLSARAKKRKKLRPKRRVTKSTPLTRELLSAFSHWNFGVKLASGKKVFDHTNSEIIEKYNRGIFPRRLTYTSLADHFAGAKTLYYVSSGDPRQDRIYITLDLDAKNGVGSYQGCVDAAEYLNRKYFSGGLFVEDSTSGSGIHAGLWLSKLGKSARQVNEYLDGIQAELRADLEKIGADISGLDVQGTCDEIIWEFVDGNRKMKSYKAGRMCKIPRTAPQHPDKFLSAYTLECGSPLVSAPSPAPTTTRTWNKSERRPTYSQAMTAEDFVPTKNVKGIVWRLLDRFNEGQQLKAKNRYAVSLEDWRVAVSILTWVYENPGKKKKNLFPQTRAKKLWDLAVVRGHTERVWNHRRWGAIREFLNKCGHLEIFQNEYIPPTDKDAKDGQALEFSVTEEFVVMVTTTTQKQGGGTVGLHTPLKLQRGPAKRKRIVKIYRWADVYPDDLARRADEYLETMYAA